MAREIVILRPFDMCLILLERGGVAARDLDTLKRRKEVVMKASEKMIDTLCDGRTQSREWRERGLGNCWLFLEVVPECQYQQQLVRPTRA